MSRLMTDGTFFGRVVDSRRVSWFTMSETTYSPGFMVPVHAHENPMLCQVLAGRFAERSSRRVVACDVGALLYHPMNEGHAHRFGTGPTRLFNVQVDRQWLSTVPDLADPRRDPVVLRGTRANALATRVYTEFKMRDGSSFSIEACMLALLAEIYRTRQPETPVTGRVWLSQAREILHHRFRERIDLVDLAATVGVHPVHFSRAFHQKVGCTLTEYVQRLRIDYARAKLATTEEPLSFIAIDAGFADQGHFTRRFRQATGTTPARFRAERTRAAS